MLQDAWSMCTCSNVESYQGSIVICLARSCGSHPTQVLVRDMHALVLKKRQFVTLHVLQGGSCQSPAHAQQDIKIAGALSIRRSMPIFSLAYPAWSTQCVLRTS